MAQQPESNNSEYFDNNCEYFNISSVDGRYRKQTRQVAEYFSEGALTKWRLLVEIEYLIELAGIQHPDFQLFGKVVTPQKGVLRDLYRKFNIHECVRIKEIEKTTNHDIKSIEYFIKENSGALGKYKEFIHFALTSQDINSVAYSYAIKEYINLIYIPKLTKIRGELLQYGLQYADQPMLSFTHGQAATPTRVGKEFLVYVERLDKKIALLKFIISQMSAKFGGAIGLLNAHHVAFPSINWLQFADGFINRLGLQRNQYTTQVDHNDDFSTIFHTLSEINTILLDFSRDVWLYIHRGYLVQKPIEGEVGSSTMPHKINPIDFENAEGNLGLANSLFTHLADKLPVSRLQRDLSDSTVMRNIGVPLAWTHIAMQSISRGLAKTVVNVAAIDRDLNDNYIVVAEAIQTILRARGYPNPYELLKELTRTGEHITKADIDAFIDGLQLDADFKPRLHAISPFNYTGVLSKKLL